MADSAFTFWLVFGLVLVFAEMILPGLVSVFVGLGALTVAGLLHFNHIENLTAQLGVWFASSTVYIFSLRLLVIRFYPSDRTKQEIDEDKLLVGQLVEVVEEISHDGGGRVQFGDTTWKALCEEGERFAVGEKVRIVGRENISWVVRKDGEI